MMNEFNTRKQDGDESFDLTEWLTNDVKLPQYAEAFLHHGFESPLECSSLDETALDTLGVTKIGHRKRFLLSCQKLADKWGLESENLAKREQNPKTSSEAKVQQTLSDNVQSQENLELPPILPPKNSKKSRPSPPPRINMDEQEIKDCAIECENSNVRSHADSGSGLSHATNPEHNLYCEIKTVESTDNEGSNSMHESTDSESTFSSELPAAGEFPGYEHIWEAREGEPLPLSPVQPTKETSESEIAPVDDNGNIDTNKTGKNTVNNEDKIELVDEEDKDPSSNVAVSSPPPIPPRADLEEHIQPEYVNTPSTSQKNTKPDTADPNPVQLENNPSEVTSQKNSIVPKRKAPMKPPRTKKPTVSMLIQSNTPVFTIPDRRSVGSNDQAVQDHDYENEVFPKTFPEEKIEKMVAESKKPSPEVQDNDDNIYSNAENFQQNSPLPSTVFANIPSEGEKRKPKPIPRTRSSPEEPKVDNDNYVYDTVAVRRCSQPTSHKQKDQLIKSSLTDTGSCTEDDLSGSDQEEMPEKISSEYETVNFPSKTASMTEDRFSKKEGYLYKQGGQQNNKGWKKRWVVFNGKELRYYKDKDHTNESLQRVPVAIMREVRIVADDVKRARFNLVCAGRTYMFALGMEDLDVITFWAQVLMNAIIQVRKEDETSVSQAPGGEMFAPDKEGFLKKQGNNVVADWKKRYVAVKDGKLAYYHNYEDFILASPINTIQMNIASVKVDTRTPNRFQLVTPHRTYLFQCEDELELRGWISSLEDAIQLALSDKTVINKIWENRSNRRCADCGEKDPLWASVNLVVCVCAQCIGIHRNLGVHSSKPRSLLMDDKIWSPSLIKLMVQVGNEVSNKFWQYKIPDDDKISPESSSESREEFIRKKYVQRHYRRVSPLYGDPVALGEALKQAVRENDIAKTMQLVFCGADVKYVSSDGSESRTPYELAEEANQELQMEFLEQNGAITVEPEPAHTPGPFSPKYDNTYETVSDIMSPSFHQTSSASIVYEKEGYLLKKAPNAAVWRKRHFMLKGRELWYEKGDRADRESHGLIKLKDVDEYVYNDLLALDIVTAERTYNLKAETKEEALSWYTALRNKQVFRVSLQCQELGSDGIPHLVAKSLQFVETHGLEAEGIYRKNGNKAKIRILKRLFNQDAESVMIFREEYEAHDVAGLLKEYFRELPDPLMTEDAYAHFITASLTPNHDDKLHMYKDSLGRLPEVNRTTLKAVINHLVRVSSKSQQNKMKLENISLIFGPTLMSNDQMGSMDTNTINQEFTVIGDFINYYKWLFDVGDDEVLKDKKIAEAMNKLSQLNASQSNLREVEHMTLDIYAFSTDNDCSRITVYKDTKASEVCQELASKRALAPDLHWALFQSVNNELDRPFPAVEKVLATVMETGKYSQLSKDSGLVVKENYIEQKLQAHALQNDVSQSIAGSYQTMKETKKKENWKKLFFKLEKGTLTVHKTLKSKDDIDSWPLAETTLYIGVDRDKKPLTRFGFTIVRTAKDGHCIYRYVCLEDERDLYRWINIFLKLKYPEIDDLWKDPGLQPIGYYAEALAPIKAPPNPRQRTPSNRSQVGVSANILNELKEKQLRKSIRK